MSKYMQGAYTCFILLYYMSMTPVLSDQLYWNTELTYTERVGGDTKLASDSLQSRETL